MKYGAEETGGSSSGFAATALLPSLLEPRAISSSPVAVALRESQDESALLELVPASRAADVPDPAGSTSPVFGRVLDDLSGAPIPGTRIILDGTDVAVAGSTGVFEFSSVPVGRHSIRVEQLGYEVLDTDITLVEGPGIFLDVTLGCTPDRVGSDRGIRPSQKGSNRSLRPPTSSSPRLRVLCHGRRDLRSWITAYVVARAHSTQYSNDRWNAARLQRCV